MGYLFLSISLLAGVTKGYCGKKTSKLVDMFSDSLFVNIIRMFLCLIIGCVVFFSANNFNFDYIWQPVLIGVLSGVTTASFVTTWLLANKKGAYMLVEIFLMAGMLVTIIMNFLVFKETVVTRQIIGICILFVAIACMCIYQYKTIGKLSIGAWILLILCGLSNGLCDFSQKLLVNFAGKEYVNLYQLYTYLFALLTLGVLWMIAKSKEIRKQKIENNTIKSRILPANIKSEIIFIAVMAVCLYLNSYFKTLASAHLSAVILYPLNQGMSLLLSVVMSAIFFKEKPSVISICGVIFAFVALFLLHN